MDGNMKHKSKHVSFNNFQMHQWLALRRALKDAWNLVIASQEERLTSDCPPAHKNVLINYNKVLNAYRTFLDLNGCAMTYYSNEQVKQASLISGRNRKQYDHNKKNRV